MLATGRAAEILGSRRLLLAPTVRAEALFVYEDASRAARVLVDEALLAREQVESLAVDLDAVEVAAAVRLGAHMGDGEAEALAVASARRIPILSDDNAVARIAGEVETSHDTTLGLLFEWSVGRPADSVRDAIAALRARANYAPPRSHRFRAWFAANSNGAAMAR